MYKSTFCIMTLGFLSSMTVAQESSQNSTSADKIGWTGSLSHLDGGLGGTVKVVDANTLEIDSYTLKDASAPALYWWGTTDGVLKDGFRISNEQVTTAAKSPTLQIALDAGKTPADFSTVGLWCERLSANFGQATLEAPGGSSSASASASSTASSSSAGAQSTSTSGAISTVSSYSAVAGAVIAAVSFAAWMV